MSYGLIVQSFDAGNNEITQIDTTKGYIQYVITHRGQGTQVNVGNNFSPRRKILVRPLTESNGNYSQALQYSAGMVDNFDIAMLAGTTNGPIIKFVTSDPAFYYQEGMAVEDAYNPIEVEYIILQDVSYVDPEGDYGLQTLTAGGDSAFDSRKIKFNNRLQVDSVVPAGSVGGGGYSTDVINTDSSQYIDLTGSFWDNLFSKFGIRVLAGTQETRYMGQIGIYITGGGELGGVGSGWYVDYYDNFNPIWLVSAT